VEDARDGCVGVAVLIDDQIECLSCLGEVSLTLKEDSEVQRRPPD
jgi:hypothetical protein